MGTAGPNYAGAATAISGTWSGLANSQGSGTGTYATWTSTTRRGTATWQGASFGLSVPAGAQISDVLVEVQHHESSVSNIATVTGQLFISGTAVGSPTTFTESTTDRIGSFDVLSGVLDTDIPNLAVQVVSTRANVTTSATQSIDFARITVTYSSPTAISDSDSFSGEGQSQNEDGTVTHVVFVTDATTSFHPVVPPWSSLRN